MFEISVKKGLCDVIWGWSKNFGFGSSLFTQFWRCKYGFVYYSNVQRTFKDGKIKLTVFTRPHAMKRHKIMSPVLTRAPLGYFYNAPHWGGGYFEPPLISETTGPILKIQAAFESPGKTVEGKQILLTSGSRVTSQVRSKSKCSTFQAWWHRRAKLRC